MITHPGVINMLQRISGTAFLSKGQLQTLSLHLSFPVEPRNTTKSSAINQPGVTDLSECPPQATSLFAPPSLPRLLLFFHFLNTNS